VRAKFCFEGKKNYKYYRCLCGKDMCEYACVCVCASEYVYFVLKTQAINKHKLMCKLYGAYEQCGYHSVARATYNGQRETKPRHVS